LCLRVFEQNRGWGWRRRQETTMGTGVCVVWRRSTEDVFFFFFFVVGYAKGGDVWDFIIAVLVIKTRCVNPTTLGGIVFTPLGCRLCAGRWGRSLVKRIVCGGRGRGRTGIIGVWCGCHFVCFTVTLLLLFYFNSSCKGLSAIFRWKSISIFCIISRKYSIFSIYIYYGIIHIQSKKQLRLIL